MRLIAPEIKAPLGKNLSSGVFLCGALYFIA